MSGFVSCKSGKHWKDGISFVSKNEIMLELIFSWDTLREKYLDYEIRCKHT